MILFAKLYITSSFLLSPLKMQDMKAIAFVVICVLSIASTGAIGGFVREPKMCNCPLSGGAGIQVRDVGAGAPVMLRNFYNVSFEDLSDDPDHFWLDRCRGCSRRAGVCPRPECPVMPARLGTDRQYREAAIINVHIPKTGGTHVETRMRHDLSKNGWPKEWAFTDRIHVVRAFRHVGGAFACKRGGSRSCAKVPLGLIMSKRSMGTEDLLLSKYGLYTVMMRDPVSRVMSHMHYVRPSKLTNLVVIKTLSRHSDNEWLQLYARYFPFSNEYGVRLMLAEKQYPDVYAYLEETEMKSHVSDGDSRLVDIECDDGSACARRRKTIDPPPRITEEHLAVARQNMANMAMVGIMEFMDESMALFDRMKWGKPIPAHMMAGDGSRRHRRPQEDVVHCGNNQCKKGHRPADAKKAKRELNASAWGALLDSVKYERRLYSFALHLFRAQLVKAGMAVPALLDEMIDYHASLSRSSALDVDD